jgi:hypothetical protein
MYGLLLRSAVQSWIRNQKVRRFDATTIEPFVLPARTSGIHLTSRVISAWSPAEGAPNVPGIFVAVVTFVLTARADYLTLVGLWRDFRKHSMAFQDKNGENTSWTSPSCRLLLTAGELTAIDSVRETRTLKEPGSAFLGELFLSFSAAEWKNPSIARIYLITAVLKSLLQKQSSINLPYEVKFLSSTAQSEHFEHQEHNGSFKLTNLILCLHVNYTQNMIAVHGTLFYGWYRVLVVRGVPRGVWGVQPPEILKFDKAEPNSQFRGKYIRNCLVFLFHHPN